MGNQLPKHPTKYPAWPFFADDEISAVEKVLKSGRVNYWTGEECKMFEQEFAEFIGVSHAISLANGTLALEAALHALDIGPGDEVIVPCRTFIATASAVVTRGAKPIVADIDPISQNITAETISKVLSTKTKAIIVVHLAGWPCAMDEILSLAAEKNLKLIEDCAQAHGAEYKGQKVGSFGDVAAFSFCQDKIMTTAGEGGMLTTKDYDIWKKAWMYKDHGKNPELAFIKESSGFRWLHESFGTNFRMTEIQAAIGREQLRKLPEWLQKRRRHAQIFNEQLANIPQLRLTIPNAEINHAYYKYYAFFENDMAKSNLNRDQILKALSARGIPCGSGSCGEIYLEKAFVTAGIAPSERFQVAKKISETSIMLLVHPTLSETNILEMATGIKEVLNG